MRYAPREALLRDLERAEVLARQIQPELTYPEDFVVFRVTGYRPELTEPAVIPGDVLLGDLPSLVEHLCAAANLRAEEQPDAVPADELANRWSVSRKTLARYRKHGLVARRVKGTDDRPRLVFLPETISAFEQAQSARIKKAAAFTRVEPDIEDRIVRRARVYRARFGCSLNQAAARLAKRFNRSHEAVRQMLRRYDERAEPELAIFSNAGPLQPRARELAYRAWRRAIEPGTISRRVGKPAPAVLRVINEKRAGALQRLLPMLSESIDLAQVSDAELNDSIGHPLAQAGLGIRVPQSLGELMSFTEEVTPPSAETETARGRAYIALRARAIRQIQQLPKHGARATDLDRVETDLRWASRLQTELIRSQLGVARRALESRVGHPLDSLPTSELSQLLSSMIAGTAAGVDRFQAFESGRLAAPVGLSVDRRIQSILSAPVSETEGRARPRFNPETSLGDWSVSLSPWQVITEPDPRVRQGAQALGDRARLHLTLRYGWAGAGAGGTEGGEPPLTLAELAERWHREVVHLARSERSSVRRALALVRSGDVHIND